MVVVVFGVVVVVVDLAVVVAFDVFIVTFDVVVVDFAGDVCVSSCMEERNDSAVVRERLLSSVS